MGSGSGKIEKRDLKLGTLSFSFAEESDSSRAKAMASEGAMSGLKVRLPKERSKEKRFNAEGKGLKGV